MFQFLDLHLDLWVIKQDKNVIKKTKRTNVTKTFREKEENIQILLIFMAESISVIKNKCFSKYKNSSFEGVSTDHRIVTAKIRLSLRKNDKRTATTKHHDWALLNNKDVRDKYVLELRNRFETLQEKTEKSTPNDEYENFVNAHLEAAAKCIPTKIKTKYRVPWETLAVREKRALVKTASKNYRKKPNKQKCLKTKNGTISISRHIYKGTDRIHPKSDR